CAVGIAEVATSATAAAPPALARLLPALATFLACGFSSGGQFLVFVFLALFGAGHVRRGGAGFVLMRLSGGQFLAVLVAPAAAPAAALAAGALLAILLMSARLAGAGPGGGGFVLLLLIQAFLDGFFGLGLLAGIGRLDI